MKRLLHRLLPVSLFRTYHAVLALTAAMWFRFPGRTLIVIGITGTKGKSSVANLIEYLLREQGHAVGLSSTPRFGLAGQFQTNSRKMTMPGRFALQSLLRRMVSAGCRYAIIEMTSEGLAQHRSLGIPVDIAVFTNLTPEHIESHGSFAAYREAKGRLFRNLRGLHKKIGGVRIPKITVVNADDPNANYFLNMSADRHIAYRTGERQTAELPPSATVYTADRIRTDATGASFHLGKKIFKLPYWGLHAVSNALAAIAVCETQGISLEAMQTLLAKAPVIPGRMEPVETGQPFRVFVDYAHEPVSLAACYDAVRTLKPRRMLCVLGSQGGGRDRAKRPLLGEVAGRSCDQVFVTNEDPYDDDPQQIIDQVAGGAAKAGKVPGKDLFMILDRRQAIQLALQTARPRDTVVITGKGNEPWMVVAKGQKIPWDDRQVVKELLGQA